MRTPEPGSVQCPRCHAGNEAGNASCFLCGHALDVIAPGAVERPAAAPSPTRRPTFHLSTFLLLIALIAVFLGIWHEDPGVAVPLAIPAVIALARTATEGSARGRPLSAWGLAWTFLATFSTVVVIAVATVSAFFFTCMAGMAGGEQLGGMYLGGGMGLGLVLGIAAGWVVAVTLTLFSFKRMNRTRSGG